MTLVRHNWVFNRGSSRRNGFSLLETSVAVSILGVGLIMVAAVFPVALTQHRNNVDQSRALQCATLGESLLRSTLDPDSLYVPPTVSSTEDSAWYLLPSPNLFIGANDITNGVNNWDYMEQTVGATDKYYANLINGNLLAVDPKNIDTTSGFGRYGNVTRSTALEATDILGDRVVPFTTNHPDSPYMDDEMLDTPNRMVWYGFYRRLATGSIQYAVAVCKQRRHQMFAEQDLTVVDPFTNPDSLRARRLPVPWRVRVACWPGRNVIWNAGAGKPLSKLAPVGSKLMVQGTVGGTVPPFAPVPAGKLLTVSDYVDDDRIEVMEDLSDLPAHDGSDPLNVVWFDIWVFPPAVAGNVTPEGDEFEKDSPLIEWKLHL